VEAFVPRGGRRPVQLLIVFASLVAAFAMLVLIAGTRELTAQGSIAIDGPGILLQGTLLLVSILAAMLIAERMVDPSGDAFAPGPPPCRDHRTSGSSPSAATCRPRSGRCSCSPSAGCCCSWSPMTCC
jgi:NADH-quinone oxidoreductase subunit N